MDRYDTWKEAHIEAIMRARLCQCDVGIWRKKEFGRDGFNIRLLPRVENRYGDDLRCEVVKATDAL
jgi:hypothetical protein